MRREGSLTGLVFLWAACTFSSEGLDQEHEGGSSGANADTDTGDDSSLPASTTPDDGEAEGGHDTSATGDSSDDTGAMAPCSTPALAPGEYKGLEIDFDGYTRTYELYIPQRYDAQQRVPLVFNMHGLTSNPSQQARFSQMNPTADEENFVVVYPAGVSASWNAGACCGSAKDQGIDDVGFLRELAYELHDTLCVDPRRTYATGMSNGAFMSHRLACEASDVFAAIAPVAGVLGIDPEDCQGTRAVPVMHFHGTADTLVPYNGSNTLGFMSAPDSFASWAAINGCTDQPKVTFKKGDVTCETYAACNDGAQVTLCTIDYDAHCWPGNQACPFGKSTSNIHASVAGAQFFAKFSL